MTNRMKSFLRPSPSGERSSSQGRTTEADDKKQQQHCRSQQPNSGGSISRILAAQEWDRFRTLMSTEVGQVAVQNELLSSNDFAAESALAYASRFHPPMDVLRAVADLLPPDVASRPDPVGRSPLHIAVKAGAPPPVVRYLAEMDPAAGATQDKHGRTPLHYAAQSYASNYDPRRPDDMPKKEAVLEVVRYLCKLSPTTVNLEDDEEYTALEYAIENDLDIKVVRSLQKACEKDWKKRRAATAGGPKQRHDDVRQNMQLQQQRRSAMHQQQMMMAAASAGVPTRATNKAAPTPSSGAQPPRKARKRGSHLMPADMDIAEVSKALQALETEPKRPEDPSAASSRKVPLGRENARKGNSKRALMA